MFATRKKSDTIAPASTMNSGGGFTTSCSSSTDWLSSDQHPMASAPPMQEDNDDVYNGGAIYPSKQEPQVDYPKIRTNAGNTSSAPPVVPLQPPVMRSTLTSTEAQHQHQPPRVVIGKVVDVSQQRQLQQQSQQLQQGHNKFRRDVVKLLLCVVSGSLFTDYNGIALLTSIGCIGILKQLTFFSTRNIKWGILSVVSFVISTWCFTCARSVSASEGSLYNEYTVTTMFYFSVQTTQTFWSIILAVFLISAFSTPGGAPFSNLLITETTTADTQLQQQQQSYQPQQSYQQQQPQQSLPTAPQYHAKLQ